MKNRLPLPTTIVAAASPGACGMYTRCSLSVTPVARYTGVLEHPVYVYTRVCIIYDRNIAGCSFAHEHAVSVYLARYFPRKKKGKKERKVTSLLLSPLHPFFPTFFLSPLQTHRSFNWISRERKEDPPALVLAFLSSNVAEFFFSKLIRERNNDY